VLVMRILAVAAMAPVLARLPLARLEAVLEPPRPARRPIDGASADRMMELIDLAIRLGGPLVRPGCLTRGVTAYWFLRRHGEPVSLVFGIDAARSAPTGHCWLESDSQPRYEKVDPRPRFAAMASIPARG